MKVRNCFTLQQQALRVSTYTHFIFIKIYVNWNLCVCQSLMRSLKKLFRINSWMFFLLFLVINCVAPFIVHGPYPFPPWISQLPCSAVPALPSTSPQPSCSCSGAPLSYSCYKPIALSFPLLNFTHRLNYLEHYMTCIQKHYTDTLTITE